jgi:hypothetical protein
MANSTPQSGERKDVAHYDHHGSTSEADFTGNGDE